MLEGVSYSPDMQSSVTTSLIRDREKIGKSWETHYAIMLAKTPRCTPDRTLSRRETRCPRRKRRLRFEEHYIESKSIDPEVASQNSRSKEHGYY